MVNSMTGFAARQGDLGAVSWNWEIRSVNARGLDIRLRLPEGMDAVEAPLRKAIAAKIGRGNVTLTLRMQRAECAGHVALDTGQLSRVISALKLAEDEARAQGVNLAASSGAALLGLRGVVEISAPDDGDPAELIKALQKDIAPLVADFAGARADEGASIGVVLDGQLKQVRELVEAATQAANDRSAAQAAKFRANLASILDNAEGADPDRVAQELAILAIKADVTEELDRLQTHVKAAEDLLQLKGVIGRKFDFLMQEFNREANTLCSKSGSADLTAIGLNLKTVIDQMREQVQNVE